MNITIFNDEQNINAVKVFEKNDDKEHILLPGTGEIFNISNSNTLTIVEIPALVYVEKELIGPMGKTVEIR